MIRFSPTKYLYKIQTTYNKHLIRQHICQNKVLISLKIYSHLHRQTIFHTQHPIPHQWIRVLRKSRQFLRPSPQISLHLLPIWCCQVRTNKFLYFFNISFFFIDYIKLQFPIYIYGIDPLIQHFSCKVF